MLWSANTLWIVRVSSAAWAFMVASFVRRMTSNASNISSMLTSGSAPSSSHHESAVELPPKKSAGSRAQLGVTDTVIMTIM